MNTVSLKKSLLDLPEQYLVVQNIPHQAFGILSKEEFIKQPIQQFNENIIIYSCDVNLINSFIETPLIDFDEAVLCQKWSETSSLKKMLSSFLALTLTLTAKSLAENFLLKMPGELTYHPPKKLLFTELLSTSSRNILD